MRVQHRREIRPHSEKFDHTLRPSTKFSTTQSYGGCDSPPLPPRRGRYSLASPSSSATSRQRRTRSCALTGPSAASAVGWAWTRATVILPHPAQQTACTAYDGGSLQGQKMNERNGPARASSGRAVSEPVRTVVAKAVRKLCARSRPSAPTAT